MAKASDALPDHLKSLTLASLLVELRKEKDTAGEVARQAAGHQIDLANDLSTQTSQVASENNIPIWGEGVDRNLYCFETNIGPAFVKAIEDDVYEVSNDGTDFRKLDKRNAYLYVLSRLGFQV